MLPVKWLAAICFIYIIGIFLGATFEIHTGTDWAGNSGQTQLSYLLDFKNAVQTTDKFNVVNIPTAASNYFNAVVQVATLNFEFFQGTGYSMVYWILIIPFIVIPGVAAIFYALYLMLIAILPF
jgi:hypothetical protein